MMQPQSLYPFSSFHNSMDFSLSEDETSGLSDIHNLLHGFELSTTNFSVKVSYRDYTKELQFGLQEEYHMNMQEAELFVSGDTDEISTLWESCVQSFASSHSVEDINMYSPCSTFKTRDISIESTSPFRSSMILSEDEMDVNDQLSLLHLLKAHAEAMYNKHSELQEVIQRRISEKVNPLGNTLERLFFYVFKSHEQQYDHLRQESVKNFEIAFKAFYNIFPFGKFSHFAANSAILEAMPADAETLNIIDFDIGEGIQWAPVIDALGQQKKGLTLTSVKWESDYSTSSRSLGHFENTKARLICHATSAGVILKVMEVELKDLVSEINRKSKREWLAFNCQIGLPHMGRARSQERVIEFLRVAKDVIKDSKNSSGIISIGNGEVLDKLTQASDYFTFFSERLAHSQALLEAMEWTFTDQLTEAKMTMEFLFMAPNMSFLDWVQQWKDMNKNSQLLADIRLEGVKLSPSSLLEAKGLVRDGDGSYSVRLGGQNENEMSLEWRGIPLVKVSTWR